MTYPNAQQVEQAWAKAVAQAWQNPSYKAQLVADPAKALGITLPPDVVLKVDEGATDVTVSLPLPPAPAHGGAGRLAADDVSVTICSTICCC